MGIDATNTNGKTMKTINFQGRTIELTSHAVSGPSFGHQRFEAGRDASGAVYFKGKTGRWTVAHQTRELAEKMLASV